MKQLLISINLVVAALYLNAQSKIDSLEQIWYDETQADSIRLEAARKLYSFEYIYTQPDSAVMWANRAYILAEQRANRQYMAFSLHLKGVIKKNAGELDEAIDLLEQSLEILEALEDKQGILSTAASIANAYARKHDFANAINYDLRCLKIAEELGNDFYMTGMLNNIGTTYMDLKDYDIALDYFYRALDIQQHTDNEHALALEGVTMINIGSVFIRQDKDQKALEYYQKALILNEKYDAKNGIAVSHFSIGEVYFDAGNSKQAKYHFEKSLVLHRQSKDVKAIAKCLTYFGRIYQNERPDSSFMLTQQALEMAQEAEALEEISEAAKVLSDLHERKGQYREALVMQKLYRYMRDSVDSESNRNAVLRAEYQYAYDKKRLEDEIQQEQQSREQELRLQRERFMLFGGLSLFLLLGGFFLRSRYQQNVAEREKLLQEIELLKERLVTQSLTTSGQQPELKLDKEKIESKINTKLGESSWMILNIIFRNPTVSNKQIADQVNLSLEGVSSSLRRMYVSFQIDAASNKKIALVKKAVRLSLDR